MEATLKASFVGFWLLPWLAAAGVFWMIGIFWLQLLHSASDDPGVAFRLFLAAVLAAFIGLAYRLPVGVCIGWQRHASALGAGALVFVLWAGAGICFILYVL